MVQRERRDTGRKNGRAFWRNSQGTTYNIVGQLREDGYEITAERANRRLPHHKRPDNKTAEIKALKCEIEQMLKRIEELS
jgi:hypothetical protein